MTYGLVDMRDGRILQRVRPLPASTYTQSFGFTVDGRGVWFATAAEMLL